MNFTSALFLFACLFQTLFIQAYEPSTSYLDNRLSPSDKRYSTFQMALELLEERQAKVMVETGTARCGAANFGGDGSSTVIFADWAKDHESLFYSVDISPEAIAQAQEAVGSNPYAQLVCGDSVAFLRQFDQPIDFLYLDSYDFDLSDPSPSQQHHMKEILAAYPKLTSKSIVMIDDCALPYGGKGALVIPFLVKRGWTIAANGYQVILIKE